MINYMQYPGQARHLTPSTFLIFGVWLQGTFHIPQNTQPLCLRLCGLQLWGTLHFALSAWDLEKQSSSGCIILTPLHAPNTLVQSLLHSAPSICQIRAWSIPNFQDKFAISSSICFFFF